ncbi:hypothetical protein WR25_05779 [Diploscapter pachys]|uniref:Ig-like domain-containing protein n=1 Tax=Diploscapter pachys TaxID=2018661 RepID=A0A2A2K0J6_9BILA|nr:hypothetical protein WR25_05779 [Diploscapter pachys]
MERKSRRVKFTLVIFSLSFVSLVHAQMDINTLLGQKSVRPPSENSTKPLDVKLGMYLESLGNFRSSEMSFDVDIYVYMSWRDSRLTHNYSDYVLINDDNIRKHIWLPDLYFSNARKAGFQHVTVPNFSIFINSNGEIAYSLRCTLTVACSLDLRLYPMDYQLCSIRVLSYAHIETQVNVTWFADHPINRNKEIGLPEFEIDSLTAGYCNGTYRYAQMATSYKYGSFSCLSGNLFLARSIGYNLVQSYIPTGLIVMISWVSFWIDRRAVPARVTLSFTTLVSLTTLGNGLRFGLPQVSYAKAIDLWFGSCMFFVFGALLEFAIVNSYMRKTEKFDQMAKKIIAQGNSGRRAAIYDHLAESREQQTSHSDPIKRRRSPADIEFEARKTCSSTKLNGTVTNKVGEKIERLISQAVGEKLKFADEMYELTPKNNGATRRERKYFADDPSQASLYDNVIPYINEQNRLSDKEKQKLKEIENEMNELESSELIDSVLQYCTNQEEIRKNFKVWDAITFLKDEGMASRSQTIESRLADKCECAFVRRRIAVHGLFA